MEIIQKGMKAMSHFMGLIYWLVYEPVTLIV